VLSLDKPAANQRREPPQGVQIPERFSDPTGAVLVHTTVATTTTGHRQLLRRPYQHAGHQQRGGGEGDRPKRPARRNGAKSDVLDATRAAPEVLAQEQLAQPRARGDREARRVLLAARRCAVDARTKAINRLKALIVSAPPGLRGAASPPLHRPAGPLLCPAWRPRRPQHRASGDGPGDARHRPTHPAA
jgi:hypothetical protein